MEEKKKSEKNIIHEKQEPHDAAHCHINDPIHSHPDMDCGHRVDGPGPGVNIERDEHTGPGMQIEKDATTGPGVGLDK